MSYSGKIRAWALSAIVGLLVLGIGITPGTSSKLPYGLGRGNLTTTQDAEAAKDAASRYLAKARILVKIDGIVIPRYVLAQKMAGLAQDTAVRDQWGSLSQGGALHPRLQIENAARPQLAARAIANSVLNTLVLKEAEAEGRTVPIEIARDTARRGYEAFAASKVPQKGLVLPKGQSPETVFLSPQNIQGIKVALTVKNERSRIVEGYSDETARLGSWLAEKAKGRVAIAGDLQIKPEDLGNHLQKQ